MTSLVQLFGEPTFQNYLNVKSIDEKFQINQSQDFYFRLTIMLSEEKEIEIRRVIGIMQFLSDTGGFYSSLFIIGAAVNFLLSGQEQALQLLTQHFYVSTEQTSSLHGARK